MGRAPPDPHGRRWPLATAPGINLNSGASHGRNPQTSGLANYPFHWDR